VCNLLSFAGLAPPNCSALLGGGGGPPVPNAAPRAVTPGRDLTLGGILAAAP
jgi:hypothetical protein